MHEARVLVVDDSAAMRALFSDLLEQTRNVRVVGTAASAAEARDQIAGLRPNVLTLDVEMPGMSGIEFLAEVIDEAPMPVVMLSSLTQSGTETSLRAYELGAVECFPKPLKATPEQFAKTVGKLGKIVLAAANSTDYGLSATVWTSSLPTALRCARELFLACGLPQHEASTRSMLLYAYVFGASIMIYDRFDADIPRLTEDIRALIVGPPQGDRRRCRRGPAGLDERGRRG